MSSKRPTDWRALGCAAAIGAAVALPAGIFAGRAGLGAQSDERRPPANAGPRTRDINSPGFRNDPYVIDQQRRVVEALETSCRESKQHCAEAEQARLRIEEAAAGK